MARADAGTVIAVKIFVEQNVVAPVWGTPILAYGPGDSSLDHTPQEHILVSEYERAIEVLAGVLAVLAA